MADADADADHDIQDDNGDTSQLRWGDPGMDQSMPVDVWVDSIGAAGGDSMAGEWLNHLAGSTNTDSPTSGLYPASRDPSSSEVTLAPEGDQLPDDPMALIGHNLELQDKGGGFRPLMGLDLAPSSDPVGRVSLVVDQCDRNALNYLLDVAKELKGRVKLEINM